MLHEITKRIEDFNKKYCVIFMVNSSNLEYPTNPIFDNHSEYFSDEELDFIFTSASKHDIDYKVYLTENEFLDNILKDIDNTKKKIIVFNASRGGYGPGKKSLIPAFCQHNNITYTGSNPYVVSLARNKYHYSKLISCHGIKIPVSYLYNQEGWLYEVPDMSSDYIVKPNNESASMGVTKVDKRIGIESLTQILKTMTKKYNQPILVQEFIYGKEMEAPVICFTEFYCKDIFEVVKNSQSLESSYLDYDDKYNSNYSYSQLKDSKLVKELTSIAIEVAKIIGIKGVGRVDFRVNQKQEIYVIDIATSPFFVKGTSYQELFMCNQLSVDLIVPLILMLAVNFKMTSIE